MHALNPLFGPGGDEYLTALAARRGLKTIKRDITELASKLRSDGYSEIRTEELIAQYHERWKQGARIRSVQNGGFSELRSQWHGGLQYKQ